MERKELIEREELMEQNLDKVIEAGRRYKGF